MKKSLDRMLKRTVAILVLLTIIALPFSFNKDVQAASHTAISDTLSRLQDTTTANHTIQFDLATAWDDTEALVVDFVDGDGFSTAGFANTEAEDFDITWEGAEQTIVAAGGCSGAAIEIEVTTVDTTTDTFTFTRCTGDADSAANDTVVIEIGTNATAGSAGNDQIVNATSSGSKTVSLTGPTSGDSAQFALAIMSGDQVTVSATVDPSVTSSLSASTCTLGTLVSSAINFCSYTNTVSTNATSGYASTIVENGNLCSPSVAVCTNTVDDAAGDNDVDQASEEYGVSSNDTTGTQDIIDSTGCDDSGVVEAASAITTSAQVYADSGDGDTGPVSGAVTTVCHSASVSGTTPAGSYSHIVTHITTGTF
ncbi:MAG: hypothetical protein WD231_04580 [Candidatus Woykebacteria bacterium]